MNQVAETFAELKRNGRKALVPFFTAGYPNLNTCYDFARMALDSGADMLELGVPFSDPMADGPAIQYSSQVALDNGIRLKDILSLVSQLKKQYNQPIILMGYFNPLIAFGVEPFLKKAAEVGVDGLIIPDLPVEEGEGFRRVCDRFGVASIFLVAPTSDRARIKKIEELSSGFVYAVSIAGTTGARGRFGKETYRYFASIKNILTRPFVIGFGISSPEMARAACRYADGAVIGSAFVDIYRESKTPAQALKKAKRFLRRIRREI